MSQVKCPPQFKTAKTVGRTRVMGIVRDLVDTAKGAKGHVQALAGTLKGEEKAAAVASAKHIETAFKSLKSAKKEIDKLPYA